MSSRKTGDLKMVDGVEDDVPTAIFDEKIVLIGDLHGNLQETLLLWERIEAHLGKDVLSEATVIFLGDYVDKGPNSRGVIDFLVQLQQKRQTGKTHFICGNHDFGMACYLGCMPADDDSSSKDEKVLALDKTQDPKHINGFYPYPVEGGMHYQGRRWGTYQAQETFKSYGVKYGMNPSTRIKLIQAVPESHRQFLSNLKWIHEQDTLFAPGRLICVHAGLRTLEKVKPQLRALHARDWKAIVLHEKNDPSRIAPLIGRFDVRGMPEDLRGEAILVSGHHGECIRRGDRFIIDQSGGMPSVRRGIQALILPDRKILSSASS